jgi:hypothetical protein
MLLLPGWNKSVTMRVWAGRSRFDHWQELLSSALTAVQCCTSCCISNTVSQKLSPHTDRTATQPTQLELYTMYIQATATHITCKYIHCICNHTRSYNNTQNIYTLAPNAAPQILNGFILIKFKELVIISTNK